MSFRILGPLEVEDDGRQVDLGGTRQRALLAILLLHRGQVVSSDRLIDDLYGARPPATATKSLHVHVSRLRKALGASERLQTRSGGYVLEVAEGEVDVDTFIAKLDEGRRSLASGDAEPAARKFGEALGLWRGPALADIGYHDFAQGEVARLEELVISAHDDLWDARLALGHHAEIVGELEQAVTQEPLRERSRAQLMLALYRCGRQADALASYQDARQLLVEELGLEPGRALQDLERAILNQDPDLDPVTLPDAREMPPELSARGRRAAGLFVGRTRELGLLEDALTDARSGRGRLALLEGEAGIGKSRLADELAAQAVRLEMSVMWGSCWEAGGAPAFWPWVQALRTHTSETTPELLREQLGRNASDIAHLLPELRELFPDLPEPPALDSEGARFRLFDSTAAFLRRLSLSHPVLVVLDDVHAADTSSLLLLELVASEIMSSRILIVAAYRNLDREPGDPTAAALADVGRRASIRLSLAGLDEADVASFIAHSSPVDAPTSLVAAIAAETEGNPLFVGEIVRLLAAEGRLSVPADPSWRPSIPETVREVIGRRLQGLTHDCRETLTVASILGREFRLDLVGRLSERTPTSVLELLAEAEAGRVLTEIQGAPGKMRFGHALIRDTLYDSIPQARRLGLHRRAVEAIEELATDIGPHLSELAHHSFQALPAIDPGLAVEHARRAAAQASELLAHEEAARLFLAAHRAHTLRATPSPDLELVILLALGDSLTRSGERGRARDAFLQAAVLGRAIGSADGLGAAALGYSGRIVWSRAGGDRLIVALLEEALEAVGNAATPLRARLLARLAGALRDERDPARRIGAGELAVEIARRTDDPSCVAYALAGLCAARHGIGDEDERLAIAAELRETARQIGDKEHEFEALTAEMLVYGERGDMADVYDRLAVTSALGEELRQPSHQWFASTTRGMLALHEGRFDEAESLAEMGHKIGRRTEPTIADPVYALQLYELRRHEGRSDEARTLLAQVAGENPARPLLRCALARLALDNGAVAEARQLFEELASNDFAVVPRDNEWLLAANYLTDVCRGLGDTTRALALYEELTPSAARVISNFAEGSAGSVERLLGILAALLDREEAAIAHLRAAIDANIALGARPWIATAQVELGELLGARSEGEEARRLAEDAFSTAEELGMAPLAERARKLLS